jgi:O-antigen/teichoic acid export membrane protein
LLLDSKQNRLGQVFAKGVFHVFIVQSGGAVLLLISEIVLARLLGVEQFGLYAKITVWVFVFFLLGTLGFNHVLLRYVPVYIAHQSWGELRGLLSRSTWWTALASVLLAGVAFAIVWFWEKPGTMTVAALAVALLGLPLQALAALRQAVLRGLQQNVRALFPEQIIRPLVLLFLLGLITWSAVSPLIAVKALACNLVAVVIAFVVGSWWQHRYLPAEVWDSMPVRHDREWLDAALPLLGIVGLGLVASGRIDIILIGALRGGDIEAGMYAAANRLAEVILFVIAIVNIVVVPMIAHLHSTKEHDELQRLVSLAVKLMLCSALPLGISLSIFGKELLVLFGPDFAAGYSALLLLTAAQMIPVFWGPVLFLLTMTGYQREALKITLFAVGIKLIMALLLIPRFGMTGAAGATLAGVLVSNMLMRRVARVRLGIDSSAVALFFRLKRKEI